MRHQRPLYDNGSIITSPRSVAPRGQRASRKNDAFVKYFYASTSSYIRPVRPVDLTDVLPDVPPSSSKVEVRACRDVWAVHEGPGLQSLFTDRERAIEHARRILGGQGLIEIRNEDFMLLATVDLRESADVALAV